MLAAVSYFLLWLNLSRFLSVSGAPFLPPSPPPSKQFTNQMNGATAELCSGGPSFRLQGRGVGLQGGLGSAGAELPSAAWAAAATAFCFGLHGKRTAAPLQNGTKLAANWNAVSTEDTIVHSARLCCLGSPGALGNKGRSAAK